MEKPETKASLLVAATNDKVAAQIRSLLPGGFSKISCMSSLQKVRQTLSMEQYDILLIYTPLPDDSGVNTAMEMVAKFPYMGILLIVPKETYQETVYRVGSAGIMVLPRPVSVQSFTSSVQCLIIMERRLKELSLENEKLEKKLQDERYISRAKALLIERKQMTETDAHKYLEHTAMNQGLTRREVAIRVIRENGRIIVNT